MDLYQWLTLLAVSLAPLAMGWFPCSRCGGCPVACSTCVDGRAPARLQIEVAGVQNFQCQSCADYDRTYIVTWTGAPPPSACNWWLVEPLQSCDANVNVDVVLPRLGSKLLAVAVSAGVTTPFNKTVGLWSKEISGDELICTDWDYFELTPGGPETCDPTNATCHVTSL